MVSKENIEEKYAKFGEVFIAKSEDNEKLTQKAEIIREKRTKSFILILKQIINKGWNEYLDKKVSIPFAEWIIKKRRYIFK
ncbi:hypothetical protein [Mesomycoplasma dispar]|uniref:hypothetical protein n=1 Tax=Mesomycoplasma dispar TaxID=86660 RepID=UPI0005CC4753|nr:hypothetical protein [Mesomycoplasma dispar]AJR12560.1 hypothetical protein MDIS_02320 [Mesomycoplasma dispar]